MKFVTFFGLPLLASAAALETRQAKGGAAGFYKTSASPEPPRIRKDARRELAWYGPYNLKGSTAGASGPKGGGMGMGDSTLGGQTFMLNIKEGICSNKTNGPCTVFGGNARILYKDGTAATPATGIYIHHLLTTDRTKKVDNFLSGCDNPNRPGSSVSGFGGTGFVGVGEDSGDGPVLYTARDGSSKAGYWVAQGDVFMANIVLVNYNKEPKTVYVVYDLETSPEKPPANTKGMLISISQCAGKQIKVSTTGPTNTTSGKWTFLEDGHILAARGHLHDGGQQMDMFINNKYVCSSKATYGGADATTEVGGTQWKTISSMSYCDGPITVKKGDALAMTVEYDLKKYPLRKSASGAEATGVMGMWSITFAGTK